MDDPRRTPLLLKGPAVLCMYGLVALASTFPLAARLTTHFPGGPQDKDVFTFLWDNWWIYTAIVKLHTKPYYTTFIYAPFLVDLRFHALGLLYGLLSLPAMAAAGQVVALNLQILATPILNGYATFKLARYVTKDPAAAFVAGLLVAATPAINYNLAVGRASYAALWPLIFALCFFVQLLDDPRPRTAALLAASLAAMLLADQQVAIFGAIWLAIVAAHAVAFRRRELWRCRHWLLVAVAFGTFAPGYVFYVRPFMRAAPTTTVPAAQEAMTYSYPLSLFWTPSMFWPVYGTLLPATLILAAVALRRERRLVPWFAGAAAFLVLSLGPVISGTEIPLPFALLQRLPGLAQFRTPYRFQSPAAVGLALAAACLLSWVASKVSSRRARFVWWGALAVVVADMVAYRAAYGFAIQSRDNDVVYQEIAADDRDCLVLEVPVGVRTGIDGIGPGEELTYHQPVHRKRIINGLVARVPLAFLAFYRSSPAIMFLANEDPPPGDLAADLRRRIGELNVGYIVVHPDMLPADRREEILQLLGKVEGLTRLRSSTGLVAFRVGLVARGR